MTAAATLASPGLRALDALEAVLREQQRAMVAGDLPAIERAGARLGAVLADRTWRQDPALATPAARRRLREVMRSAAVNAAVAARGDAHAAGMLEAIGVAPGLYTASGSRGGASSSGRGVSA